MWQGEEKLPIQDMYSWDRVSAPVATFPELKAGDHVRHTQFGDGVVVSYQTAGNDAEVTVVFDGAGIKKLLMSYAKLEKIE